MVVVAIAVAWLYWGDVTRFQRHSFVLWEGTKLVHRSWASVLSVATVVGSCGILSWFLSTRV